eukprot:gene26381-35019_t
MASLIITASSSPLRGAFILFEGVDRCDRTSNIGQLINSYLQSTCNLSDQAIHLLFSANRWEAYQNIIADLNAGKNLVCDRYAYSGVAFSSAKGLDVTWCKSCDIGLPAPDCIIYLDIPVEDAAMRGCYGEERYEKIELQSKVRDKFLLLKEEDAKSNIQSWHIVDARKPIEDLHREIVSIAEKTISRVGNTPITPLWHKGQQGTSCQRPTLHSSNFDLSDPQSHSHPQGERAESFVHFAVGSKSGVRRKTLPATSKESDFRDGASPTASSLISSHEVRQLSWRSQKALQDEGFRKKYSLAPEEMTSSQKSFPQAPSCTSCGSLRLAELFGNAN